MEHFADHCAICHGTDSSGDTMFGKNIYPKPPDLRQSETQKKTDGELYHTIENGVRLSGMPAFGEEHGTDDSETWHLVSFIRHVPQLNEKEKKDMERFNPKSQMERLENEEEQRFLNWRRAIRNDHARHEGHAETSLRRRNVKKHLAVFSLCFVPNFHKKKGIRCDSECSCIFRVASRLSL
jgi:hypothetical protein